MMKQVPVVLHVGYLGYSVATSLDLCASSLDLFALFRHGKSKWDSNDSTSSAVSCNRALVKVIRSLISPRLFSFTADCAQRTCGLIKG